MKITRGYFSGWTCGKCGRPLAVERGRYCADCETPQTPFPHLRRIHTDTGSHISPPLDSSWSDGRKLEWLAAVTRVDTGLQVAVSDAKFEFNGRPQHGYWSILVGGSSCGPFDYRSAWTYLTGVSIGAEQSRRQERQA